MVNFKPSTTANASSSASDNQIQSTTSSNDQQSSIVPANSKASDGQLVNLKPSTTIDASSSAYLFVRSYYFNYLIIIIINFHLINKKVFGAVQLWFRF